MSGGIRADEPGPEDAQGGPGDLGGSSLDANSPANLAAQDAALAEREQSIRDAITDHDSNPPLPYGTTEGARKGQSAPEAAPKDPKLAIPYRALFAIEPGAPGRKLAHEEIGGALGSPAAVIRSGQIHSLGCIVEDGEWIRPRMPIPDAAQTPVGDPPEGDPEPTPDPPPERKRPGPGCDPHPTRGDTSVTGGLNDPTAGGPPGSGGSGGVSSEPTDPGKPHTPGDGEVKPCDTPETTSSGNISLTPGPETSIPATGSGIGGGLPAVGTAPLATEALAALGFGRSAIQPARPAEYALGRPEDVNQRTRLGGGAAAPSLAHVPRGGVRLIDAWDFAGPSAFGAGHSMAEAVTYVVDRLNSLTSWVNDRFRFAEGIESAGEHLPDQPVAPDPNSGWWRTGDEIQVQGERLRLTPNVTGSIGNLRPTGQFRWSPASVDGAISRIFGSGRRGADVEIRFATGFPGALKGTGKRGDGQPKIGWDGKQKALFAEGAPLEVRDDLTIVGQDGTAWTASSNVDGVLTLTQQRAGTSVVLTFPSAADQTLLGIASALTTNNIPRADSSGRMVDSAVSDNGTTVASTRPYSAPGDGASSERYGAGAVANGASSLAVGTAAAAGDEDNASVVAVGASAGASGTAARSVIVGASAASSWADSVVIGTSAYSSAEKQVALNNNVIVTDVRIGTRVAIANAHSTLRTHTLQNADGTLAHTADLAAYQPLDTQLTGLATGSALTSNVVPRSNATAGLVDSAITDDGTTVTAGTRIVDLSGAASAKVGNFLINKTTQTAANAGSYAVAATIGIVFVAAAALGTTDNYTVTLPSAVTYAGRQIMVKITTAGSGSATLTVGSAAGNVEGGASQVLDATARASKTYVSDGTDWWSL